MWPDTGAAEGTGAGAGEGTTINVPLPQHSGHAAALRAMEEVVGPAARRFGPQLIIVSAGGRPLGRGGAEAVHSRAVGRVGLHMRGGLGPGGPRAVAHSLLDLHLPHCFWLPPQHPPSSTGALRLVLSPLGASNSAAPPALPWPPAGYDAHWQDPLECLQYQSATYHALASAVLALAQELCGGRCLFLLEGG